MKQERWLAGALVAVCAVAALGSWFTKQPAKTAEKSGTQFDGGMFGTKADVALLDISGMIVDSASEGGFGGGGTTSARKIMKAIERIRQDEVPVVLLSINSPGGTASASDAIYQELVKLKRDKKTKILATMGDLAASGGYYIACSADRIIANPATLTGSIGVIVHAQNYQQLMAKIGVSDNPIKSGPNKDILSPTRPMRPEERQILQGIVDDTYQQFLAAVSAGRGLPVEQLRPLADGRIFTGRQAQRVKLVDGLGTYLDAKREALKLAGNEKGEVRNYGEEDWREFFNNLFASTSSAVNPTTALVSAKRRLLTSGAFDNVPLMIYE